MSNVLDRGTENMNMPRAESTAPDKKLAVGVITDDAMLTRKLSLALYGIAEVVPLRTDDPVDACDIVFKDARDDVGGYEIKGNVRYLSIVPRGGKEPDAGTLPYPFMFSELQSVIFDTGATESSKKRLVLLSDERHVRLDGEEIKLTESEYKLLNAIVAGGGEFVSRESLAEVFGTSEQKSILNVYIHYLREKLERRGEKVIISSRKGGYKIDKRYLGGE